MAARVNVKFVIILSVVLVLAMAGVIWAASSVLLTTGDEHAAAAAELEAAGEYEDAARSWSRAVSDDRTRLEWLEGWKRSLQKIEHETEADFLSDYRMLIGIHRTMAEVKGADIDAHRLFLDDIAYTLRLRPASIVDYERVAPEVAGSLLAFPESMTAERGRIQGYRGKVGASALANQQELSDEQIAQVRADIDAALAADPSDEDALSALYQASIAVAERASRDRREAEADALWEQLKTRTDDFAAANPDSIRGRIYQVNVGITSALREIEALGLFGADLTLARIEAVAAFSEQIEQIAEDYLQAGPGFVSDNAATELSTLLQQSAAAKASLGGERPDIAQAIADAWDHTLEQQPDDVVTMQKRARYLAGASRFEEAIDAFQTIRDLPKPKVSTEGQWQLRLQRDASVAIGTAAFQQWSVRNVSAARLDPGSDERAAMEESAEEALALARQSRDDASAVLPEDEPGLVLLNAMIAFADGQIAGAEVLTRRYNETRNEQDARGLRLAVEIARRLGNSGEQARLLNRLFEINPGEIQALLQLAELQFSLRNYEDAERWFLLAEEQQPNLDLTERLNTLAALLGKTEIEDPFQAAMINAQRAADGGSIPEAIEILEAALRDNPTPDHVRVHAVLASVLLRNDQTERALAVADAGLQINPDSTSLQLIKQQAEIGNDIEAADRAIDALEGLTEADRSLRKHRIRLSQGELENARPFLESARASDPDDVDVLRAAFDYALRIGDFEDARAIIAQTQGRDIDGANGLTFRARLEIAEGRFEEAERTLAAAVDRGSLNADTLSLLGRVQSLRGDQDGAVESFRRAREIRPSDLTLTNDYLRSLIDAGRETLALDTARQVLDRSRSNADFVTLWLFLEGSIGSKQVAYDERVAISEARPDDQANTASLIRLCLDLRRFEEARERLDQARAERDSLTLCELDAQWHVQRGDFRSAVEQFNEFLISDSEGANTALAYLTFGSFLIDVGQLENGLTTLRQGRRLQPEDNPIVDMELGRRLFNLNRYTEAVDVFESISQRAADDSPVRARAEILLIESYVNLSEWDAAQVRLDALADERKSELPMRLLQIEVIRGRGDTDQARLALDEVVSDFPDAARPYIRRATLLSLEPSLLPDAIDDLTRAIELEPNNATAFRLRANMHMALGNEGDAVDDIIAATRANPGDDQLRVVAANTLMQMGRENRAADVIDEGLERQAGNLRILFNAGQIFAAAGEHSRAVQYLERAWEQSKDLSVAAPLINSMLSLPRPDLRAARLVVSDASLDQDNPGVLLLRARIESAGDNQAATEAILAEMYLENKDRPQVLFNWSSSLVELLDGREQAIDFLNRLDADENLSPWARFMHARVLSEDDSGTSEAIEKLTTLIDSDPGPNLNLASLRLRSLAHYGAENFEDAVSDIREALALSPRDPEMNNNIAYILGVELGQASEALPFAQTAVEIAPENRGFLDTLGTVYIEAGEPEKAIAPLERALTLATTDTDRAPVLVHLARARLETGDTTGAADAANDAKRIIDTIEEPNEKTQAELNQILDAIDTAR